MKKKLLISLLPGTALSIAALYLAFRNVPGRELLAYGKTIHPVWLFPSLAVIAICFALRALRWQIIVRAAHDISYFDAYHPLIIGFMVNCILPGRLGEALRPAILARQRSVPFFSGIATVTVERMLDLSLLIILFSVLKISGQLNVTAAVDFGGHLLNQKTLEHLLDVAVILGALLIGFLLLMGFETTRAPIAAGLKRLADIPVFGRSETSQRLRHRYRQVVDQVVHHIGQGAALLQRPATFFLCVLLTIAIWLAAAVSYHLITFACPGVSLSFPETVQMMMMISFFIALPSVPGYWGLWEAGGMVALLSMGIAPREGAAYTLVNHAMQVFPVIAAGFFSCVVLGFQVLKPLKSEEIGMDNPDLL